MASLTLLVACALSAFVHTLAGLETSYFDPCHKECVYIRFFGHGGLPSTHLKFLPGNHSKAGIVLKGTEDLPQWRQRLRQFGYYVFGFVPRIVHVTNGKNLLSDSIASDVMNPFTWPYFVTSCITLLPLSWYSETMPSEPILSPMTPYLVGDNFEIRCETPEWRSRIDNHLWMSRSMIGALIGLAGWWLLKIAHDTLLIKGCSECTTLAVGIASFFFQTAASVMAYFWSLGAIEVFIARDPAGKFACYYRMPQMAALVALTGPAVLHWITCTKARDLWTSIQHGDYLYFTQYRVPFRAAAAALPSDPTQSLLVGTLAGDVIGGVANVCQPSSVTFRELRGLHKALVLFGYWWDFVNAQIIGVFVAGPIILHLTQAVERQSKYSLPIRIVLAGAGMSAFCALIWVNIGFRIPVLRRCLLRPGISGRIALLVRLWQVLADLTYMSGCVLILLWAADKVNLSPWFCYISGAYMFYSIHATYTETILQPVQACSYMRTLDLANDARPIDWMELADRHVEYRLDAQRAMAESCLLMPSNAASGLDFDAFLAPRRESWAQDQRPHMLLGMADTSLPGH